MPDPHEQEPRYVLEPVNGGYRIKRLVEDRTFDPPMWTYAGYLNDGKKFRDRAAAREFMLSGVER